MPDEPREEGIFLAHARRYRSSCDAGCLQEGCRWWSTPFVAAAFKIPPSMQDDLAFPATVPSDVLDPKASVTCACSVIRCLVYTVPLSWSFSRSAVSRVRRRPFSDPSGYSTPAIKNLE